MFIQYGLKANIILENTIRIISRILLDVHHKTYLFRDREPVTSFSLGNVDIGDEAGTSGPGYVSPLLQGNTGDYITPLISSNRDIELQEVQEARIIGSGIRIKLGIWRE